MYDDEIAAVDRRRKGLPSNGNGEKNMKSRTLEDIVSTAATSEVPSETKTKKDEL